MMDLFNKKDIKTTWDFIDNYENLDKKNILSELKNVCKLNESFAQKWSNNNEYLKDEKILLSMIKDFEKLCDKSINGVMSKKSFFVHLLKYKRSNDPDILSLYNKIYELFIKNVNNIEFIEIKLSKMNPKTQDLFLRSKILSKYKHYLEHIFKNSKHILSEKEEKILNCLAKSSYSNWIDMVEKFIYDKNVILLDEKKQKVKATFSQMSRFLLSKKQFVRDGAKNAINRILDNVTDIAECELNAILEYKKYLDEFKNFKRCDEATILDDDIDFDIIDCMIKSVSDNFDISRRFYKLKAKLLGKVKIGYHEKNLPIKVKNKLFSFDECVNIVGNVLKNLDDEFWQIFENMVTTGKIDVFPERGKVGGAFTVSISKNAPVYILLNYGGKLNDVLTLAHEMGHAINHVLTVKKQNFLNQDISLAIAETASTFMEDFTLEYIEKGQNEREKLELLMYKLDADINSIFRQVACYMFEKELHLQFRSKGYLSKDEIGELFLKFMSMYLGDSVDVGSEFKNWWVQWSHIRRFFYVYSYASGLLISKYLQRQVRKDRNFIFFVKDMFSSGSSISPKDIFLKSNIDISNNLFWIESISEIKQTLSQAEKIALKV